MKEIPEEMIAKAADSIWNSTTKSKNDAREMAIATLEAADVPALLARIKAERIAEAEADTARLRFLITESGMDGFDGHDALDFIEYVASERGHSEPTDDDEFEGWRRLLDEARKAQAEGGE